MSKFDEWARKRIIKANEKVKDIQRGIAAQFVGQHVKLLCARRGNHSRRMYNAGTEFTVYDVLVDGRDIGLWLSRIVDKEYPQYELSVWLCEVEFLPKVKQ